MNNAELGQMSRDELMDLQVQVKAELKKHRPYRIKERFVRCGDKRCWCYGACEGHGPYLFATYREGGQTKTLSLGIKHTKEELRDMGGDRPEITDYLKIPDHMYQKMSRDVTNNWVSYELSDTEFRARHELSKEDDKFARPYKFWGTDGEYKQYLAQWALAENWADVGSNPWANYGVGTLEAVAKLGALERKKYYLKPSFLDEL